jgi:hypothetical protein
VADKGETVYGNLTGLALSGGIRLRVGGETREFTCGELRLA